MFLKLSFVKSKLYLLFSIPLKFQLNISNQVSNIRKIVKNPELKVSEVE